jgi:hypothetical protein
MQVPNIEVVATVAGVEATVAAVRAATSATTEAVKIFWTLS